MAYHISSQNIQKQPAFTLIELVFVIIILGIVASIGSSIIANVYQNYLLQRATHRASLKTELAAQQIANLLSYRIPGTTIARNPADLTDNVYVTDPTNATDITHTVLEWIGADNDGFSAAVLPPWNGFCDVTASSSTAIITPGSNLALADTIYKNLSNNQVRLNGAPQYPAIFFADKNYVKDPTLSPPDIPYMALGDGTYSACLGMTAGETKSCVSTVGYAADAPEKLTFQKGATTANKLIVEHYKLAWTAYAIRQVPRSDGLYDLKLYYNYQPWEGESLNSGWPATNAIIVTGVSVFKFAESGNTFRFKLCTQENIGEDYNVTICKEKAVIL